MSEPLNADQIAAALKRDPTPEECHALHLAIDARSAAIREREHEIARESNDAAVARLVELKAESESLVVESSMLARLGLRLNEARERALDAAAKRNIPIALRNVSTRARKVRDALRALDVALDELRADYAVIAEFPRVGECPFDDEQLAELLALRDAVWTIRTISPPNDVPALPTAARIVPTVPPIRVSESEDPRKRWPLSWRLIYVDRGRGLVGVRRAPVAAEDPTPPAKDAEPKGPLRRVLDVAAQVFSS